METGTFSIFIKWNDEPIHGSPFETWVVNPAKLKLLGVNEKLLHKNDQAKYTFLNVELNKQKTLVFDTHEVGPGFLNVDIMSERYEKIPFKKTIHNHLQKILFTPFYEGPL